MADCNTAAIRSFRQAFRGAPDGRQDLLDAAAVNILGMGALGVDLPAGELSECARIAVSSTSPMVRHGARAALHLMDDNNRGAAQSFEAAAAVCPTPVSACGYLVYAARAWVASGEPSRARGIAGRLWRPMSQHVELRRDLAAVQRAIEGVEALRAVLEYLDDRVKRFG